MEPPGVHLITDKEAEHRRKQTSSRACDHEIHRDHGKGSLLEFLKQCKGEPQEAVTNWTVCQTVQTLRVILQNCLLSFLINQLSIITL